MNLPVNYNTMTPAMRRKVREEYVRRQNGRCSHCGAPLDGKPSKAIQQTPVLAKLFPRGFFRWPVHLHHDHKTGMTIGAVHNKCNAVLWMYHGE